MIFVQISQTISISDANGLKKRWLTWRYEYNSSDDERTYDEDDKESDADTLPIPLFGPGTHKLLKNTIETHQLNRSQIICNHLLYAINWALLSLSIVDIYHKF